MKWTETANGMKVSKETVIDGMIKAHKLMGHRYPKGYALEDMAFELAKQEPFKELISNEVCSYIVTYTDFKQFEWGDYTLSFPKWGFNHKIFIEKTSEMTPPEEPKKKTKKK